MDRLKDSAIEAILEQLIKDGPNGVAPAFASLFELAMRTLNLAKSFFPL